MKKAFALVALATALASSAFAEVTPIGASVQGSMTGAGTAGTAGVGAGTAGTAGVGAAGAAGVGAGAVGVAGTTAGIAGLSIGTIAAIGASVAGIAAAVGSSNSSTSHSATHH